MINAHLFEVRVFVYATDNVVDNSPRAIPSREMALAYTKKVISEIEY